MLIPRTVHDPEKAQVISDPRACFCFAQVLQRTFHYEELAKTISSGDGNGIRRELLTSRLACDS